MSTTDRARLTSPSRPMQGGVLALLVLLAVSLSVPVSREGLTDSIYWSGSTAAGLKWPALAVVLACSVAHYLAAAAATRAATRQPLPGGETVLAQLCAAAANKLTPAGLGGSAVLARYLHRRAGLTAAGATGTVSVIALGRAVAAFGTLVLLAVAGPWVGLGGGAAELTTLATTLRSSVAAHQWVPLALLALLGAVAVLAVRARTTTARFLAPVRDILRRPKAAGTLLTASATQTLVLGGAFAAAVHVLPGGAPHASTGALIVGYIAAAAAAAAVPMPGGLGSSEAALTAVLVSSHVTLSHALADVLVFRIVTFWLPAGVGLPCLHVLRRRQAL